MKFPLLVSSLVCVYLFRKVGEHIRNLLYIFVVFVLAYSALSAHVSGRSMDILTSGVALCGRLAAVDLYRFGHLAVAVDNSGALGKCNRFARLALG